MKQHPGLEVVVRNNEMDNARALENARAFAEQGVNVAIIYHIDERIGPTIANILFGHGIRVISVDIPIPMTTYFGVNNKRAGQLAGEALVSWVQTHWGGKLDKVLAMTETRVLDVVKQRVDHAVLELTSTNTISASDVLYMDSGSTRSTSAARAHAVLEHWQDCHRIAIIGFNDDTALGGLDAARALDRELDVIAVGQGADLAIDEFRRPDSRLIASPAYFPEQYGKHLVDLALRIFNGERLPRENFMDIACLTWENFAEYDRY